MRIAIREEGQFVYAYFTADTVKNGTLVATCRKTLLQDHPELYERWKQLLKDFLSREISWVIGKEGPKVWTEERPKGD